MEAAGSNNANDEVAGVQPVAVATEVPSSSSSSFSPDSQKMPDWKKELLLKRKSKATTTPATAAFGDDGNYRWCWCLATACVDNAPGPHAIAI